MDIRGKYRFKCTVAGVLFLLALFGAGFCPEILAQDFPDVGHYMVYKPLVNAASASEYTDLTGFLYGRRQWASVEGGPATIGLHIVQPIERNSFGGYLTQESIGVHSKQSLMGSFTHTLRLQKFHRLSFGLSGGIKILTSNYADVDPAEIPDIQFQESATLIRPDFGFGAYISNDFYAAGLSIPSLISSSVMTSDDGFTGKSVIDPELWTYLLYGGYRYTFLGNTQTLEFSTLVKICLNAPMDIDFNLLYNLDNAFSFGASYRTAREALFFTQYRFSKQFKAGYCYHAYFNIGHAFLSAHELFVSYSKTIAKPVNIQSPRF